MYRNKKLLRAAKDQPCVLCSCNDGTTVAAHSNFVEHGKGTGIKAPDYFVVYVCRTHHDAIDGRRFKHTREERWELWHRAFARTVERWFQQEIVVVK